MDARSRLRDGGSTAVHSIEDTLSGVLHDRKGLGDLKDDALDMFDNNTIETRVVKRDGPLLHGCA
jgi:hypothetical protein